MNEIMAVAGLLALLALLAPKLRRDQCSQGQDFHTGSQAALERVQTKAATSNT